MIAELVKPLVTKKCNIGTTLIKFLTDNNIAWSNNVRVNGDIKTEKYKLRNNDVITTIGAISGG